MAGLLAAEFSLNYKVLCVCMLWLCLTSNTTIGTFVTAMGDSDTETKVPLLHLDSVNSAPLLIEESSTQEHAMEFH